MKNEELLKKIRAMKWDRWAERPFDAFAASLFEDSGRKESFEKIGLPGVEMSAQLLQDHVWYFNEDSFKKMSAQLEEYFASHDMYDITSGLARFKKDSELRIKEIAASQLPVQEKFAETFDILTQNCAYIWLAHGVEAYYKVLLDSEVPKYIKNDIDKFIGDATFPKKKNSHDLLHEAIRAGLSDEKIAEEYGWVKVRDGFSEPFSVEEIAAIRAELKPAQEPAEVEIPSPLTKLMEQVRELVFFRTERTDVFYYLFYLSRPIIKELSVIHNIPFEEMRYHRAKSFLQGKVEKHAAGNSFAYVDGEIIFQSDPILIDFEKVEESEQIKGKVAYKGIVRGEVRVVTSVPELDKVRDGDIMVTQMTFPSYISAMQRAAAFVTDEGGITCHAAIVARELKKPCIIGTKNATKMLKDGDIVEVDADNGIVNIIERAE